MTQLPLLVPTAQGERRPEPIEARLIHRRDDPATSTAAARKVAQAERDSLRIFLFLLCAYGPMTCREAADHYREGSHAYWNAEFNKRVKAWSVAGHIELTGETRDGGRVWRTT